MRLTKSRIRHQSADVIALQSRLPVLFHLVRADAGWKISSVDRMARLDAGEEPAFP